MAASNYRKLKQMAAKLGVNVEGGKATRPSRWTDKWGFDIRLDAPGGKQFAVTNTHALVCGADFDTRAEMAREFEDACANLLEDVMEGFEPCPADCECREP